MLVNQRLSNTQVVSQVVKFAGQELLMLPHKLIREKKKNCPDLLNKSIDWNLILMVY